MAPESHIKDYVKRARDTKKRFTVDGAKFILQLGALSKDPENYLTLKIVNKNEREMINDFLRMTVEQNIAHIKKTYC